MLFSRTTGTVIGVALLALTMVGPGAEAIGQTPPGNEVAIATEIARGTASDRLVDVPAPVQKTFTSALSLYFDSLQGVSSNDLVRRALASNGELAASRLDIQRARSRLRQASLRPNPSIDIEQTTGRFTGAQGESELSVGLAIPLELGKKRGRRIELARAA